MDSRSDFLLGSPPSASPAPRPADAGFRADIEGLRAVAVLSILLFHVDERLSPGGFAGVDIFFVISGYLITGQIAARGASFSFGDFYLRRVRRLGPALVATVIGSLIAGWNLLSPLRYEELAHSALASLLGVANVYFYLTQDYFSGSNLTKPLLHVWSLSLEEQFYLVWPLLLVVVLRRRSAGAAAGFILLLGAASLAGAVAFGREDPAAAFYLMPFRVFEFALGAALALRPASMAAAPANAAGAAGIAMILATFVIFDAASAWPGLNALLPAVGTALIIAAGPAAAPNRAVANPVFRLIGRASYSIYLVHWPLIAFFFAWKAAPPTTSEKALLLFGSLAAGFALWGLVERPFRVRSRHEVLPRGASLAGPVRAAIAVLACAIVLGTAASAGAIALSGGAPQRVTKGMMQRPGERTFAGDICNARRSRCAFGDPAAERFVYLVGDSHAMNLAYGLDRLFKREGIGGAALFDYACAFLKDTDTYVEGVADRRCNRSVDAAFAQLAGDRHPIIFVHHHGRYERSLALRGGPRLDLSGAPFVEWYVAQLRRSLEAIGVQERRVILFTQSYDTGIHVAECLARPNATEANCKAWTREEMERHSALADAALALLAREYPTVTLINPKPAFCPGSECVLRDETGEFFRDPSHLTNEGSLHAMKRLGPEILAALREPLPTR